MSADDTSPVIVGVGRYTYKDAPDGGGHGPRISLRDMIVESVARAAGDAAQTSGSAADILAAVEAVGCPGTFFTGVADGVCRRADMPQVYPNLPASVAKAAGATNADSFYYTIASGSSPQYFINKFGEEIAQGKRECVLIAGGEVLMSSKKMGAMGKRMKPEDADEVHAMLAEWHDDTGAPPPEMIAVEEAVMKAMGSAPLEAAHGLGAPVATYPIFEQALRRELGHSLEEHQSYVARICEEMTQVAALPENAEHAWFPEVQSAESIMEPSADNRYIGFP